MNNSKYFRVPKKKEPLQENEVFITRRQDTINFLKYAIFLFILSFDNFAVKLVFYEVEDISYHKVGGVFYPLLFRLNAHFLKPFTVFVKLLDV